MRRIPAARFASDLRRGKIEPLVLIQGESSFLAERAAQAVAGLVEPNERPFCLWRGTAAESDADRLLEEAATLPMGGERRVLVVRGAEKFPLAEHAGWQAYLRRPSPRSVVAFVAAPGTDSSSLRSLAEACLVVDCRAPSARGLAGWVVEEARSLGCALDPVAASWMIEVSGRDLAALHAWLERCVLHRGGAGPLSRQDLEPVSGRRAPANLFAWTDRVGERRPAEALRLAQRALEDGEEPLALLGRAASHLRRLAHLGRSMAAGASAADAARQLGVPSFLAEAMTTQARAGSERALARALAACAEGDRTLKSARVSPARILDRWLLQTLVPDHAQRS